MKLNFNRLSLCALLVLSPFVANASDKAKEYYPHTNIEILTLSNDAQLACEAILCLSTNKRPHECNKSLKKYFSLRAKKWHQTVTKRKNFLKLCPVSDGEVDIDSIASTRDSCDKKFFGGFNRKVDKCAQEEENNYQGLAQNQEQDLQNAVAQYQNAIDESKTTQTESHEVAEQTQPTTTSQAGWGDGSEAITGGAGLVGDATCVHWAGSTRLAPSTKYKISFSRLGSSTREISEFTTSQGGEFSLCLADSAFDSNKEITLTDESGNVIYVKNKKSNSIDSRSVTETKLGRFYQLHNTPISDEDKLREDQSGTYWIH